MPGVQSPLLPRKRLAAELKQLREQAGQTLDDVAQDLLISTSKLSRLETAQGSPQARDVRDLARHYGVLNTPVGERLLRLARSSRSQGWWVDYQDVVQTDDAFDAYLAYETEASTLRFYAIPYVTGLLQTADYTRALIQTMDPSRTEREVSRFVELRQARQQLLDHREDQKALELKVVMHELCLDQMVGSPKIMREQLQAIEAAQDRPNITVWVLPTSAPAHRMNTCTWSYFYYHDPLDDDVVSIETHAGFRYIETAEQVRRYDRAFEELTRRSLTPDQTQAAIRARLSE
jgi:transcriptional regulator with XRE-family HTH domain